tara:strand:+ start:2714 stop:3340 length:627 start_codon:yes stop_codon:yes gene_type:complete
MPKKVILVLKGGSLKERNINVKESDLHKKCNFKNDNDFSKRHTWKKDDKYVSLYAKDSGKANTENKYELPPPLDSELYFGKMLLVMHDNEDFKDDEVVDLSKEEWINIYNKLMGGFESLGEDDSYSSEEEVDPELLTKEGYSKEDGFVVSDEEEEDEEYIPEEVQEEEEEGEEEEEDEDEESEYEQESSLEDGGEGSELTEEEYDYSD